MSRNPNDRNDARDNRDLLRGDADSKRETRDLLRGAADTPRDDRLNAGARGAREIREDEAHLTLSEEQIAVSKRAQQAGEVDIGKRVETEHVRRSVPLSHEEVSIERHPIDPGMRAADTEIREEHLRIPVRSEEAVVEKHVVPREEIVARKHEVVEDRVVEADLRREEVEVREEGNAHLRRGEDRDRGRR